MTDYTNIDILATRLDGLTDEGMWKFVRDNADLVVVNLDNDSTFITFEGDDRDEPVIVEFDDYIGWAEGLHALASAFNVNFECV